MPTATTSTMPLPIREQPDERPQSRATHAHEDSVDTHTSAPRAVHLMTFGCAHNQSDSEAMAGNLAAAGHTLVPTTGEAEAVIINSCTVKGPSQERFFAHVRKLRKEGKHVIVAGCVPAADPTHAEFATLSVIGVDHVHRASEAVDLATKGAIARFDGKGTLPHLGLPKVRMNPRIAIIPISTGCLHACSYCKTKHARGALRSHTPEAIIAHAKAAADEGALELWLTSEDSGAYGKDLRDENGKPLALPDLLERLLDELTLHAPDMMVRLGMTNPPYILAHLERMAKILRRPNCYRFLHIPVQSGSDDVLRAMRRGYTIAEFTRICTTLRAMVPDLTIATDIICGYPTETEEDFAKTAELARALRFPILNISQFYARPGTPAAEIAPLRSQEVKRRSTEITRIFRGYRTLDALEGTTQAVMATDTNHDGQRIGHTRSYTQVLLPPETPFGVHRVRITHVGRLFVRGVVEGGEHPRAR
jgi:threonylcarbamoyladenosine tRNA methylthiotransferase CDKAL1